ncbi:DUF1484 family protein [Chromobacterium subtsugae]|uniref:DUF1484 family protein n=1 Tax=Chromobacterium subtsugae TaxID=251747 RepID=UPI000640CD1C|nr:DUF1484 family protein [Chromobacterium subtsugae]
MTHHTELAPHTPAQARAANRRPQPAKPTAALAGLKQALAQLQAMLADPDLASLNQPLARLNELCGDIEGAVVAAICHLADGQQSQHAVRDLLTCLGDDLRLPSSRLRELLLPLDARMDKALTLLAQVR